MFTIAGVAAATTAVLIVVQIVVFVLWPPPATAIEHLDLMRDAPLLGFLSLDLLYVVDNVLLIPILLALFVALRRVDESVMAVAAALGFVGVAALFASNPAANMHYLAGRLSTAGGEAERAALLAAGEAMLAANVGTAYHVSLILGSVALVVMSVVMLRSWSFSRPTAVLGILANVLAFGLYLPVVGIYVLLLSTVFLLGWYVLITVGFVRLGRGGARGVARGVAAEVAGAVRA
ncbi:MAG: hypothetical protein EA379_00715 [Phycisphaerales bacterium]|nr:MAG: hypothetical protein EA379_00715 [Phycisphaerales bacterium]